MDEILQKAKKRGYHYVKAKSETERLSGKFAKIVMEPEFWQALGKACGWGEYPDYKIELPMLFEEEIQAAPAITQKQFGYKIEKHSPYMWYAIRFHQINLTEGWKKAVEYLSSIVGKES